MIPLERLLTEVKANGYDFFALADTNLHGMYTFYEQLEQLKLKGSLGLSISVLLNEKPIDLELYIKTDKGFPALLAVDRVRPKTFLELEDYLKDLIVVVVNYPQLEAHIYNQNVNEAKDLLKRLKAKIPYLYLTLKLDTWNQEFKLAPTLYKLAVEANIKALPYHQTAYLNEDDKKAYLILLKLNSAEKEDESFDYRFLPFETIKARFYDYPQLFTNLKEMVETIEFKYQKPKLELPEYPLDKGVKAVEYLKSLAILGLKKRLKKEQSAEASVYQERLLYELKVINQMGFNDYFLIVYDFVKYAKQNQILVGPGRGSAAGSLVSYCLGITDIDPIKYNLLFERFLNPERISMPDIDLDFPDNKRDEVIRYVHDKYQKEHVASIVTFGKYAIRSSIRDVARAMEIEPSRVKGMIERVLHNRIEETDYEMVELLSVSQKLEGLPKYTGTHAAGIVLSKRKLTELVPLTEIANDFYQAQLEAVDLEKMGLLKIDFLGIRNLTIISDVIKLISKTDKDFNLYNLPLDDHKTYELLSSGDTDGLFQLESRGMRNVIQKLKPAHFEDLVALLALYRPGPMDNINLYLERRHGNKYEPIHEALESILKPTYGIIIYQEQIMQIAHDFAGYTMAEADLLRRGISKKDLNILKEEEKHFIEMCIKQNHSKALAKKIYSYIVKFADYGFNRSHSVAYSLVAYWMAYLKTHYYAVFMTVLLNYSTGDETATKRYLDALKKKGNVINSPDVQLSDSNYQFDNNTILLPLDIVKGVGKKAVESILAERAKGEFKTYQDFKLRMKNDLNEKQIQMLIYAGALDCFKETKRTLIEHINLEHAGYEQYITDFKPREYPEYDLITLAQYEKEALGFYLKQHPFKRYDEWARTANLDFFSDSARKTKLKVLAIIKAIKIIKTKQNEKMAFVVLDDGKQTIEATLFARTFSLHQSIKVDEIYCFYISKKQYQEKDSFVIERIEKVIT